MLIIVADSFQWLNVDPLGQGERMFFSDTGNTKVFAKKSGKFVLLGQSQRSFCQNVRINPGPTHY